ncbi:hypothetical protein SAMN05216204_14021 [Massilia yuzhufengensis]|uniref:Uncharacterized protein n=1 Tax=Massilia yuzhufengensis TaxID=1164594 RepID=A0A1I1VKQ8_9BURK|nr:hypothetical protein SAMN05216204_14021 [Massilia yuzhufengensis]
MFDINSLNGVASQLLAHRRQIVDIDHQLSTLLNHMVRSNRSPFAHLTRAVQ